MLKASPGKNSLIRSFILACFPAITRMFPFDLLVQPCAGAIKVKSADGVQLWREVQLLPDRGNCGSGACDENSSGTFAAGLKPAVQ